jgi:hypothetical protein
VADRCTLRGMDLGQALEGVSSTYEQESVVRWNAGLWHLGSGGYLGPCTGINCLELGRSTHPEFLHQFHSPRLGGVVCDYEPVVFGSLELHHERRTVAVNDCEISYPTTSTGAYRNHPRKPGTRSANSSQLRPCISDPPHHSHTGTEDPDVTAKTLELFHCAEMQDEVVFLDAETSHDQ